MNVLILYSKAPGEIYNRKSALGSYIHCLSLLLSEKHTVYLNGEIPSAAGEAQTPNPAHKNKLKNLIPKSIRNYKIDIQTKKNNAALAKKIKSLTVKFDLIIEFYSYNSTIGHDLKKEFRVPLICIYDAPIIDEYEFFHGKKRLGRSTILKNEKKSVTSADTIVVYSNPVKQFLIQRFQLDGNKIHIHQNIDFSRFSYIDSPKPEHVINIGFIGSFLKWHNIDFLIRFANDISKNKTMKTPVHFIMAGTGMEFEAINQRVKENKLDSMITFTGFLDHDELTKVRTQLHIGVMPGSNWYGIPNKIFEYIAGNMLVLAPSTPSINDVFDDVLVTKFETGNYQSFKSKLIELIENYVRYFATLQLHLNDFKEKYSSESTKRFYLNLIEK